MHRILRTEAHRGNYLILVITLNDVLSITLILIFINSFIPANAQYVKQVFLFIMISPWQPWLFGLVIFAGLIWILYKWIGSLRERIRSEKTLNYFATSLYGQNTVDDVLWDIAKNCMSQLKFEDCVVYQFDENKKLLIQKAAFGPKNPFKHEILNPIEIPLGKGIVGTDAVTGKPEIVSDTSLDDRYILDDQQRFSEITVPIYVDGRLFGIIDSEHHRKNFFQKHHLKLLEQIAFVCSMKISKYLVEDKLRMQIARDLHDDIGSTLSSINIISKLTLQQVHNKALVLDNVLKIKEHSAQTMETMSDIVWAINPNNDTLEKMVLRMKEFASEILESAAISYSFVEEGKLCDIQLNLGQRKDVYLIFKEALNNAVKYSGATELNVLLRREENNIKLQVSDNGKGFDVSKEYSGNGLKNIHSRAEQMGAILQIQSFLGQGTTIFLNMHIG